MSRKLRIQKLDAALPKFEPVRGVQPDLNFRVAGKPRSEVQRELIRRLQVAVDDPRATDEQRAAWRARIKRLEQAIRS